ncbi:CotH kinase family protein [Nitratidesulfovibrio termitidis]|uniref:CotH kinase family protein n=1 Tax=Nitratidesulfovibrio termitidis TaxID=42252 RepID=UPI0003FC97AA|nr:CotH kinase family protein [Nitratidesulfovibrio termitidis]
MSISTTPPSSPPQGGGTAPPSGPRAPGHVPRISLWAAALFVAALLCAGLLLERTSAIRQYRFVSLDMATRKDALGSPRKRQLLAEMGLPDVHAVAPENRAHTLELLEQARRDADPAMVASGWPVFAVRTDDASLNDPESGINVNHKERGREWERPAAVVYYRDGQERLATGVGLRLHGGGSRDLGIGYRLYFRNAYGTSTQPADLFFHDAEGTLKRLVLRKEKTTIPGFINMLGLDIMGMLGAETPRFVPAVFSVNGKDMGLSMVSEHIAEAHWKRRLGHGNFLLYSIRKGNDRAEFAALRELYLWLRLLPAPMTMQQAERRMDLRSMCAIIFGAVYLGESDWDQGAFLLDKNQPDPRWTNIAWDLDEAFQHLVPGGPLDQRPGWKYALDEKKAVRMRLFLRLWKESPEFRDFFLHFVTHALNHTLNDAARERLFARYEALDRQAGNTMFDEALARRMLANRADEVLEETVRDLKAPRWHTVQVSAPGPMRIDGEPGYTDYTGRYFEGQRITVAPPAEGCARLLHWEVDDTPREAGQLDIDVRSSLRIRAVCTND